MNSLRLTFLSSSTILKEHHAVNQDQSKYLRWVRIVDATEGRLLDWYGIIISRAVVWGCGENITTLGSLSLGSDYLCDFLLRQRQQQHHVEHRLG